MQTNNVSNNKPYDFTREDEDLALALALSQKEAEKATEEQEGTDSSDEELQKVIALSKKSFKKESEKTTKEEVDSSDEGLEKAIALSKKTFKQDTKKRKREEEDVESPKQEKKPKVEKVDRAQEIITELRSASWRSKKINFLEKAAIGIAIGTAPTFLKSTASPEDRKVVGNLKHYGITGASNVGELCDKGITVINENYPEHVRAEKLAYLKLAAETYSTRGLTATINVLKQ